MKTTDEIRVDKGEIIDLIRRQEAEFKSLFSKKVLFDGELAKWEDNTLPDMYDHNQFVPVNSNQPSEKSLLKAVQYQREHGRNFFKYESRKPLPENIAGKLKSEFGVEGGETYTMYLPDNGEYVKWKENKKTSVTDLHDMDIMKDIIKIEEKNYLSVYGADFLNRKVKRYTDMVAENEHMHYLGAFQDGKIAGACYAYVSNGIIQMDDLIVNKECRNQYVATTLMKYIAGRFGGIFILHADEDDTPKDMYSKMGFRVIDSLYEYASSDISSSDYKSF